ncbi:MAG: S8 family serine peptidase [Bifidobacteriaceae bacterium]|jgi:subtilisin family serine protease|nr:S8 family serine peptidase [Bifidobacteriaceae bacterium]
MSHRFTALNHSGSHPVRRRNAAVAAAVAFSVTAAVVAVNAADARVGASPGAGAALQAAAPALVDPVGPTGKANRVRLITGDLVRLSPEGKVLDVEAGPRADASQPHFTNWTANSHTFVVPSDVQKLIGDQLDLALFDVTELASYGLGPDSAVPVIVQSTVPTRGAQAGQQADLSDLGVEVKGALETLPAQFGDATTLTDLGPAPSWSLIEAVADPDAGGGASARPTVEKVWLDRVIQVQPSSGGVTPLASSTPVWMETIGADVAKGTGLTGAGVKVAVVDTGIDSNHPDLAGQVVAAEDFTDSGTPEDVDGHGTFVASEIAGTGVASGGTYEGVAPGAQLLNARVLDDFGSGTSSGIMAGVEWAAEQGADIINMSLGYGGAWGDGTSFLDQFINEVATAQGKPYDPPLIVIAAGNAGPAVQTVYSPAVADKALTVGATSEAGNLAYFSSTGPRRGDGAVKPEIMAPGAGADQYDDEGNILPEEVGPMTGAGAGTDGYVSEGWMGTSMAAPLVAGAAALLLDDDSSLGADDLRAKLIASAKPLPDDSTVFQHGAGLVNIPAALNQTVTTSPTQLNLGAVPYGDTDPRTETLTYANQGAAAETLTLTAALTLSGYFGPPVNIPDEEAGEGRPAAGGDGGDQWGDGVEPLSPDHVTLSALTLVVPAGGAASVDVTVDQAAFATGYVGGYVTATNGAGQEVRTPIGLANEPQKHELTIIATDKDGEPIDHADVFSYLSLTDLEYGDFLDVATVDGRATVELVAGSSYVANADSVKTNASGGTDETTAAAAVLDIQGPTTLIIDGTTGVAAKAVTNQTVQGHIQASEFVALGDLEEDGFEFFQWFGTSARVTALAQSNIYLVPFEGEAEQNEVYVSAPLSQPLVEASLEACGTEPVPIADATGRAPLGHSAFTLAHAPDGTIPAGGNAGQALLTHLDDPDYSQETILGIIDLIDAVERAGYGALIIESNLANIAVDAGETAPYLVDPDVRPLAIPVLVTNVAGGEALAGAVGQPLYLLNRGTPQDAYLAGQTFDPSAEAFTLDVDENATVDLTVQHRAMGASGVYQDDFVSELASGTFSARAGSSYVAHLTPGLWTPDIYLFDGPGGTMINNFWLPEREYSDGQEAVLTVGSQVHSAGFETNYFYGVLRAENELVSAVPLFVDGQGQGEWMRNFPGFPEYGAFDLTLTDLTTGDVVFSNANDPEIYEFSVTGLDPAAHTYRLDQVTTSNTDEWAWSTDVTSSWQWVSAEPTEPDDEGELISDEPLRQAWYELPGLDAYNSGAPSQLIVVHASQLAGSQPIPLETVTLEASTDDGATWTPVELTLTDQAPEGSIGALEGETLYAGQIEAAAGQVVSLRSRVAGGSSAFDQTVLGAYPVTDSPQDYLEPASWNSCGIDSPLPLQLSTQVVRPFQAKGQSPDDTVTLSLAEEGAEWRADANGAPANVKVEGTFYGGSKSAFAAQDQAPANAAVLGTASVDVTLPTSGDTPVTVNAAAGFTVPTSQYGTWVWRVDPDSQSAPVRPLIPAGVADKFGQRSQTVVTQMGLTIHSALASGAQARTSGQTRQLCDVVWLEHGSAGDLWLDRQDGGPVQVLVDGGLYKASSTGEAVRSVDDASVVKQFELTFTATGRDHAQTVCHAVPTGKAATYSFQYRIGLNRQGAADAQYLSQGATTDLWRPEATVVIRASGGKLPVTGSNDLAPIAILSLLLTAAGAGLFTRSRRRARAALV